MGLAGMGLGMRRAVWSYFTAGVPEPWRSRGAALAVGATAASNDLASPCCLASRPSLARSAEHALHHHDHHRRSRKECGQLRAQPKTKRESAARVWRNVLPTWLAGVAVDDAVKVLLEVGRRAAAAAASSHSR